METISCTGLQENQKDLDEFFKLHPEFDQDIFDNPPSIDPKDYF